MRHLSEISDRPRPRPRQRQPVLVNSAEPKRHGLGCRRRSLPDALNGLHTAERALIDPDAADTWQSR
jgi:hypothetical protein